MLIKINVHVWGRRALPDSSWAAAKETKTKREWAKTGEEALCINHISWSWFIPNGVSCCSHVCYGTGQPFIFDERGIAKTEKHTHAQEKKEKKFEPNKACEKVYASLTYFWDFYNRNVTKEVLIFLILFKWEVLKRNNFVLPDINQYCSHCRICINLQWKVQDKP